VVNKNNKYVAIALSLGDILNHRADPGTILGRVIKTRNGQVDGAIYRYDALVRWLSLHRCLDNRTKIMATGGYSKEEPLVPNPGRPVSLADQLRQYLVEVRHADHDELARLSAYPCCWGTGPEIRMGIALAKGKDGFIQPEDRVTLIVATNWSHIPRVWLYCLRYKPKAWKLRLLPVSHYFSWWSRRREVGASIVEAWRLLRDRVTGKLAKDREVEGYWSR